MCVVARAGAQIFYLRLSRLINPPDLGFTHTIKKGSHCVRVLSRRELLSWTQLKVFLLLYCALLVRCPRASELATALFSFGGCFRSQRHSEVTSRTSLGAMIAILSCCEKKGARAWREQLSVWEFNHHALAEAYNGALAQAWNGAS